MAEEVKKKTPSEMSDEEFLEYLASLGSDEDEVIDEGAEGEAHEVGEEAEATDTAESVGGDADTADDDSVASEDESGNVEASADTAEGGAAASADADEGSVEASADEGADATPKSGTDPSGGADAVVNEWLSQEKALKKIVPNFSLNQAFANPQFKKLVVDDGMDIIDAYQQLNPQKAESPAVLDEIGRSAAGANGSSGQDVESMSDEEFSRYIQRLQEEE